MTAMRASDEGTRCVPKPPKALGPHPAQFPAVVAAEFGAIARTGSNMSVIPDRSYLMCGDEGHAIAML